MHDRALWSPCDCSWYGIFQYWWLHHALVGHEQIMMGLECPQTRLIILDAIPTVHQLKSWYLVQGCIISIVTSTFFWWTYPLFQDFCSTWAHSLGHYCLKADFGAQELHWYRSQDIRGRFLGISRNFQYFSLTKDPEGPKDFFLEIVVLKQWIHIDPYRSTYPTNKKPLVLLQSARYQHLWPMGDAYPQTFDRLALPFRCADGGEEDGMGSIRLAL